MHNKKYGRRILLFILAVVLMTGCGAEKKAKEIYEEGLTLYEKAEYSEAIASFENAKIKDADTKKERTMNKKIFFGLGVANFEEQRFEEAEKYLKEAIAIEELKEWNQELQWYLLDTLTASKKTQEAYKLVVTLREEEPKDFTLIFKEYYLLKEQKMEEEAFSLLNEALSISGFGAENKYMRARAYYYLGNVKKAQKGMEKAIKDDIPEAMFYMGRICEDNEEYGEAISWYDKYAKLRESVSGFLYLREAECYAKLDKRAEALSLCKEGIASGDGSFLQELRYTEIILLEKELSFEEAFDKCSEYVKEYDNDETMKKEYEFLKTRIKDKE